MEHPPDDGGVADATGALLVGLVENLDEGFAELVRREERVVYTVALRMTRSHMEAEDLTAEAFLLAYRALRGYDEARVLALRPRSWLITIMLNIWRNAARNASRRPSLVPVGDVPDTRVEERGVEQAVESDESQRELGRLIAQLTGPQRVAVVLRFVVGMTTAEVAAVLGCPEGTAKSHVSRGLTRLRSLYNAAAELNPGVLLGKGEHR